MTPKWLIEDFNRDEHVSKLIEVLEKKRVEYHIIEYLPFESGSYNHFSDDECIVFYGSLNLARQLRKQKKWIPGVWCDLQAFKCTSYYPFVGKFLLNSNYVFLPVKELGRRKEWIYENFGIDDCVFIRPNSGFKTFTGKVVQKEFFDIDYEWMVEFSDDDSLAVISLPQKITQEWRFIVADKLVITGSTYKFEAEKLIKEEVKIPNDAWNYAQEIANENWQPERMYVLDICKSNGLYLLEANSFSCSGFYDCNSDIIVEEANRIAIEEWEEYH